MEAVKNIQQISDDRLCSGCGACVAVCPANAVSMQFGTTGRLFATVGDPCIDCGLCLKACPSASLEEIVRTPDNHFSEVWIGRSADKEIYRNGQSGGCATALLKDLFDRQVIDGAIVCRSDFSEGRPEAFPFIVTAADGLAQCQKSCYTPVPLLRILREAETYQSLAIVGLPCHLDALAKLQALSPKFRNVKYKLGLVCDTQLCAGITDYLVPRTDGKRKILFRAKGMGGYGYMDAPVALIKENGETLYVPKERRMALKNLFSPSRCRICPDKLNASADIVLGDPWGMKGGDLRGGDNVIAVRTQAGLEWLHSARENGAVLCTCECKEEELLQGQHIPQRLHQVEAYYKVMKGERFPGDKDYRNNLALIRKMESGSRLAISLEVRKALLKSKLKKLLSR